MKTIKNNMHPFARFVIVATSIAVLFLFLKKDNIITWIRTGFDIAEQKRRIEFLERRNAELEDKIRTLAEDKDSLETFARENYFFAEPGEDVFILDE